MTLMADWADKEWAVYLKVSERTVRDYFRKGIIHGARKDSKGEWRATGNGLNKYLTHQNMARACGWKQDEAGDYIDPRLSNELKEAFKPLFDSYKERFLRRSRMWRIASAYRRAIEQMPIEQDKLDELEEAARSILSSSTPLNNLHEVRAGHLKGYLPNNQAMNRMKPFYKSGLRKRAELVVAALSAINIDGLKLSNRLPSSYAEWKKIRGHRSTGKLTKTIERNYVKGVGYCRSISVELKPNKASPSQFKAMMQRYGRKTIILEAKGLHPDTSDILPQHEDWGCHEGAANWQIEPHKAMVS